jgi:hypothetical protein
MFGHQIDRFVTRAFGGTVLAAVGLAGLWIVSIGASPAAARQCEDGEWALADAQPPSIDVLAYDTARGVLVCLAGDGSTWESAHGQAWEKRTTAGPGPRPSAAMAYDEATGRCVLFGGLIRSIHRADTWEWDGQQWTLIANGGPPGRNGHAMVYDAHLERVVMFGGITTDNFRFGDTWAWDGAAWTLLTTEGPSPRYGASFAYDTARQRVVLFGGRGPTNPFDLSDTWEFDGASWTQVATSGPPRRMGHGSAYDAERGVTVVYGGYSSPSLPRLHQDTWEWNGVSWTEATPTAAPGARGQPEMTFDTFLGRVVMCGGTESEDPQSPSLVWGWNGATWSALRDPPAAPPVSPGYMAYDSVRQVCVAILNNNTGNPPINSTWEWNGAAWHVPATGANVPFGVAAFDTVRAETIVFTGLGETWTWDGTAWFRVASTGPDTGAAAMAFDTDRGVAVLFGSSTERRTWEWDGVAWSLRSDPGPEGNAPSYRSLASMCYDSHRQRIVLFGGFGDIIRDDTWEWDGTEWQFVTSQPLRFYASMTYDSVRERRVLFGGSENRLLTPADSRTFESSDGPWTTVDTTGPSPRNLPAMVYDAARNNIVLFGGILAPGGTWIRTVRLIDSNPSIVSQPVDREIPPGGWTTFHVVAESEGTTMYQWRKDGQPLTDDGRIVGARAELLSIVDAVQQDAGLYDVVVTNGCGPTTTDAARLVITVCAADFNSDGILNSQDFFDYLNAFFENLPSADFDASGTVDSNDFFAFLDAFFAACP